MRGKTVRGWVLGSACLLLLVMLFVSFSQVDYEEELLRHLKFTYADEEKSIDLSLWRDEDDGRFYLFLPSWLSEKEALLEVSYGEFPGRIVIDEEIYPDGSMWRDDGTESLHALEICGVFGESHSDTTIQVLASANLPSLFVTVEDRENILTTEEFEKKKYIDSVDAFLTKYNVCEDGHASERIANFLLDLIIYFDAHHLSEKIFAENHLAKTTNHLNIPFAKSDASNDNFDY